MGRAPGACRAGYRFLPDGELWNPAFFRELATSLAYAPLGCSLAVEDGRGDVAPRLRPRDPLADGLLVRAAGAVPGRLVDAGVDEGPLPVAACAWMGVIVPAKARSLPSESNESARTRPRVAGERSSVNGAIAGVPDPDEPAPSGLDRWAGPWGVRTRWTSGGAGTLSVEIEFWCTAKPDSWDRDSAHAFGAQLRRRLASSGIPDTDLRVRRARGPDRRRWHGGVWRRFPRVEPFVLLPRIAATAVVAARDPPFPSREVVRHHLALAGASGSGKSALLSRLAVHALSQGIPALAFDVHGDLFPGILGSLPGDSRRRVVALDPARPESGGVGLSVLDADVPGDRPRLAAQAVAALRWLSSEGGEVYWGFRLERIFDTFVRLVQEERGDLLDLYELLTEERRREASRLATREPSAARFLDELAGILKRNPEFLWPSAARLAKIVQDPRLGRLLAPRRSVLDVDVLLASGRSLFVRLPIGEFGPEGVGFAASLITARAFLSLSRELVGSAAPPRAVILVDEAHLFAPRLLAEILSDGRKFGIAVFLATQYPERLAPDLQAAIRGSVGSHLVFRVPRASAEGLGRWVGLGAEAAGTLLPALPPGMAIVASHGDAGVRRAIRFDPPTAPDRHDWERAVEATRVEFDPPNSEEIAEIPALDEVLLLSAFAIECEGRAATVGGVLARAFPDPGLPEELAVARAHLTRLVDRGWVEDVGVEVRLTRAGRRYLGYGGSSGAPTESAQHRALLLEAFRIFARKGHRIDLLRQGRFDTRLPDAVYRQVLLPPAPSPWEVARAVDRARPGWAWSFFRQRDVHIEAEVSGATRRERILGGIRKAAARDAFVLFVVGDAHRAQRVRAVLRSQEIAPSRGQVWTLRPRVGGELLGPERPLTFATD